MTAALDVVPLELLVPPSPSERRGLDRDDCAIVLDGLLRRLARREALCRRVVGRLARPFLVRRAHVRLGVVRIHDYATERLGISGREFEELGRVSRRLEALPAIAQAFADGALSWSHVRLLATVATPETEGIWLACARGKTVRALVAAVAAAQQTAPDPDETAVDDEPRVRFYTRVPRRVRRLWQQATELASRMSGARIPTWRAAEAIAAEGLASDVASGVPETTPITPGRSAPPPADASPWEALTEALPDDVETLARDADALDPFQLDARLRAAIRARQRIDFQTGRLLGLLAQLGLHRAFGFHAFADYVRDRLGMSPRTVRALRAVDRRLPELPMLAAAYRDGRISLGRALALLPVLHPDTEAAWTERAQEVTYRRLAELVDWAVEIGEPDHPLPPPPSDATLDFPPPDARQMCARDCDAEIVFPGPASVVGLFRAAIHAFTPPGAPPWQGLERLLCHAIAEWRRQPRHRDPIFERDGWRCAVPACTARARLHDHHIVYRSRGGDHARDNRVAICAAHHLRGIHGMTIRVDGVAPHDLTWQLGVRTGRPPLLRTHGDRYLEA
ncbi:MAG TPA: HNH endonuclease signature motif containing protein [Candidatus Binatia bacterium]|nr:HNH endonuclease signature motif containing protein [Candidatus Binatia bacterium]